MPHDNTNLLPLYLEIDRTYRRNLKALHNHTEEMVEEIPKAIWDYFQPTLLKNQSSIMNVSINVNNFELKPRLIQMARELAFIEEPMKILISTYGLSWRYAER